MLINFEFPALTTYSQDILIFKLKANMYQVRPCTTSCYRRPLRTKILICIKRKHLFDILEVFYLRLTWKAHFYNIFSGLDLNLLPVCENMLFAFLSLWILENVLPWSICIRGSIKVFTGWDINFENLLAYSTIFIISFHACTAFVSSS